MKSSEFKPYHSYRSINYHFSFVYISKGTIMIITALCSAYGKIEEDVTLSNEYEEIYDEQAEQFAKLLTL